MPVPSGLHFDFALTKTTNAATGGVCWIINKYVSYLVPDKPEEWITDSEPG